MYLRASVQQHKLKRDENMILNSRREWFSKTEVFLQAFQKLPQNVHQNIGWRG